MEMEAVLLDLNGTLHIQDLVIPGAQEALKRLRATGIKIKFVTNTTEFSMRILHEHLTRLGFDIKKDEIYSAISASKDLVIKRSLRPYLMVDPNAIEEFSGIDTDDPNAVVLGLAPDSFNYDQMNRAFRLMLDGAPLIAMFKTRYYPKADGEIYLGPGAFVAGLEFSTGHKAEVVGKPATSFFLGAIQGMAVNPHNTYMVGDDVHDDVEGALNAGMKGVLVKTGKYRAGDENKISPRPTLVCDNFPSLVDYIIENNCVTLTS